MEKKDILSFNYDELGASLGDLGLPRYRTAQVYDWLHKKCVSSFDEMTNLSRDLRAKLDENYVLFPCHIEKKLVSCYDGTVKYLFRVMDGEYLECVVMKYKYGRTICISTQVGCKMGCAFCASGIGGFRRNLAPSEMLGQIYTAQRDLGERISRIVLMGMGEPLDNFDNVMKFLQLVSDERGLNIGMRHISLSTSGIVPRIYDLLERDLQLTLSVSLHAPNDEIRSAIMPVNTRWNVEELLTACRTYAEKTSRRISFEYAMMKDVNDTPACAEELAARLKGLLCHVNLIPANEVAEKPHARSSDESIRRFCAVLEKNGVAVTVRRTLGSDINASCGQLRRKQLIEDQERGDRP